VLPTHIKTWATLPPRGEKSVLAWQDPRFSAARRGAAQDPLHVQRSSGDQPPELGDLPGLLNK